MESELELESNTNTQSSRESIVFGKDDSLKSPESSDCEGYATPLASSLPDLTAHGITINLPDYSSDDERNAVSSGELTPKPKILVMTQRLLSEEDIRKALEENQGSSEDEFFDVTEMGEEEKIRDVAQQFLDGVDQSEADTEEVRVPTPIVPVDVVDVSGSPCPVVEMESEIFKHSDDVEKVAESSDKNVAVEVDEEEVMEVDQLEANGKLDNVEHVLVSNLEENAVTEEETETEDVQSAVKEVVEKITLEVDAVPKEIDNGFENQKDLKMPDDKMVEELADSERSENVETFENAIGEQQPHLEMEYENEAEKLIEEIRMPEKIEQLEEIVTESKEDSQKVLELVNNNDETNTLDNVSTLEVLSENTEEMIKSEVDMASTISRTEKLQNVPSEVREIILPNDISDLEDHLTFTSESAPEFVYSELSGFESESQEILETDEIQTILVAETVRNAFAETPVKVSEMIAIFEKEPCTVGQDLEKEAERSELAEVPHKEIEETTLSTQINSDEVQISQPIADLPKDEYLSDVDVHDPNDDGKSPLNYDADADGYSSDEEQESLSSSTSSESFEFAESVPSPVHDEKTTQALRNSIIERYPSHETDEDELDVEDLDEDLLAVKQISAEVEQLVAAINAFGRDEEQQMSAYLVGKNMAAEKRKKSAMMAEANRSDQIVQTDNDIILANGQLREVMESLQVEINRLQEDLEGVKNREKELLKVNGKLQEELNESQQTIDGIEVEAEQQYTELTSEIDELCEIVLKKDQELATIKEKVANLSVSEINLKDDVDAQRVIVQRQKEIIEGLREELDNLTKKLGEVMKSRDKAIEDATIYKMKNMERDRFLSKEAQMSMEIEDLQRELNKQKLILNNTSMAKLADTFDRKVLHLENELRERDMLICKQNQIINSHRRSPTGSIITTRKMQPRASVLAAAGNLPSAGSSSESFQNGLDIEAKEALLSFILSDRHNQLANIYNIGRILDLTPQEERAVERHLTKDRFT